MDDLQREPFYLEFSKKTGSFATFQPETAGIPFPRPEIQQAEMTVVLLKRAFWLHRTVLYFL